jgi:hypothetical protein
MTMHLVSGDRVEASFAPVIAKPVSGGEIRIGTRLLSDYPRHFEPGQFLIVTIAPIE